MKKEFISDDCLVCIDIKDFHVKTMGITENNNNNNNKNNSNNTTITNHPLPPSKDDLGRATWTFLHTMAAYYPTKPDKTEQKQMSTFIEAFSFLYPCKPCAEHFRSEMEYNPPDFTSRWTLSQWLCEMHNSVNEMLGKPLFPCGDVLKRWRGE